MAGVYGYRAQGGGAIRIEGLRETQKALKDLSDDLKNDLRETHRKAAEVIVDGSKRYVPFRTGKLAVSIRALATRTSGKVRVGSAAVPYAGPIHFGWPAHRIKPQPFVYDALDDRRNEVLELYQLRINGLIAKHGLDGENIPGNRLRDPGANIKLGNPAVKDIAGYIRDTAGNITGATYFDDNGNLSSVRF